MSIGNTIPASFGHWISCSATEGETPIDSRKSTRPASDVSVQLLMIYLIWYNPDFSYMTNQNIKSTIVSDYTITSLLW